MAMVDGSVENRNVVRVGLKYSSKADDEDEIFRTELHGFSDPSSLAYGVIFIYVLFINLNLLKLI